MSDQSEETKNINELKYEGLTALIIEGQHQQEIRHNDFVKVVNHRFDKLDNYNTYQNGHVGDAMEKIAELEKESAERKLTCMVAVQHLQKTTKYTKLLAWADKHQKRALFLLIGVVTGAQILVLKAVTDGWWKQIWQFLRDVT